LKVKNRYRAAVFTDLERHSNAWTALPTERAVAIIDTYRQVAEENATRFGASHQNFTGDGHLFLFNTADLAVQFALSLIDAWQHATASFDDPLRLRVGCHYGECTPLEQGASWIGRAIGLAKRVEGAAEPGSLYITETVLELLDIPIYKYEFAGRFNLKGDHLAERGLYRVTSFDKRALMRNAPRQITAEDAFLRALALGGSTRSEQEEQVRWYREALKLTPHYAEAHNNLAIVLRHLGDEQEAAVHYREALQARPNYPEAHYNYALLLAAQGKLAGASDHLTKSIEQRPDYALAHHALANILKLRGDWIGAEEKYRRALELRPKSAEAHNDFAIFLHQQGQRDAAREHFRQALQLRPEYPEAHYNFALLLEDLGQVVAAQKHYEGALAVWPDYPEAHNNLAALLYTQGCLEEAEPHYRKALSLRPSDAEAHYNYGLLLRAKGQESEAQRYFSVARNLTPEVQGSNNFIEPPS
jgi:Tfp pilus assembly protein PilF/class 3 adenylate cyclase